MTQQNNDKSGQSPQMPPPSTPLDQQSASTPDKRDEDKKGNAPQKDQPADK